MKNSLYDVIIIGAGSAGLTAGIYAGRARLKTLIIDKAAPGGQIAITAEVANYPGIADISGADLGQNMLAQARRFGAEFMEAELLSAELSGNEKTIRTSKGDFQALSVIIAAGAKPRTLGFAGEEEYRGRGIGYCATCDGEFFTGMDVFVVGAGFAAAEEALFLTRYARKVTVIAREPAFTCPQSIADKVLSHPKIEVRFHTELTAVGGDKVLKYAHFVNNQTGEKSSYQVAAPDVSFGVFVFVGYAPQTGLYKDVLHLNPQGYIETNEDMQTNLPGVYAAGDIRPKKLRQLVTAVSDGAIAATEAERYVHEKREALGLHAGEEAHESPATSFLDDDMKQQLTGILSRLTRPLVLKAILNNSPVAAEMRGFLTEFAPLSPLLKIEYAPEGAEIAPGIAPEILPTLALTDESGRYLGVQFHGVPGGHEMNSFVLALYNAAGPGQALSDAAIAAINAITQPVNIKIGVSLSCTLCPDVVAAAQLIALRNPLVSAEMIDVAQFADFKAQHAVMSVPAVVINNTEVHFGKKPLEALAELAAKG